MAVFSEQTRTALDSFVTPVWVIDVERAEFLWANQSALTLFDAFTLRDLFPREPMRGASAFLVTELAGLVPGGRFEGEFKVQASGSDQFVSCTFTGIESESGGCLALVEAHTDALHRRAPASLGVPDVEQRLQSRDRMASIGTLTAGVVHGINNPLSYVIANLEYVKRLLSKAQCGLEAQSLSELGDVLDDSLDGAERVRRIVADLGSFSRPVNARVGSVDLQRAAERALSIAANEIRHRASVVREFSAVPDALGTEAKLGQVILNVLINAAHSIDPGAIECNRITLRTRLDAQGRPTLEIQDTGCGIAKENLARVFDPFFTTKPVGVGTGLGLSMAHRIVRDLGGEIRLDSVHGEGTCVTLTLPVAPISAVSLFAVESVPPFSAEPFRARVLVIDDEPAILRAFRRVLFAHEVSLAASGLEAMHELARSSAFDVIFCDVMMPEMSGMEVYQRIKQQYPGQEQKLVFMTGGAFSEPSVQFFESVPNEKLKKPFTGSALRALLANVTRAG